MTAARTIWRMSRRLLAVLFLLASIALAGCSGDDGDDDSAQDTGSSSSGDGPACSYNEDPAGASKDVDMPPDHAAQSGQVAATMKTTIGDFELTLDADSTPCTVNSFVSLAEQGYFDDTTCHRLTTSAESGIAVLQCGDPTGTGSGGPGYAYDDELTGDETYPSRHPGHGQRRSEHERVAVLHRLRRHAPRPGYTVFGTVDDGTVEPSRRSRNWAP